MKFLLCSILFLTCSIQKVWALDLIDKNAENCIRKAPNHARVLECASHAEVEWDKKLNYYYKLLYNSLPPNGKQRLKASQLNWLKFRDSEFQFISGAPYPKDWATAGNMWSELDINYDTELIKERALQLKAYYETFRESK